MSVEGPHHSVTTPRAAPPGASDVPKRQGPPFAARAYLASRKRLVQFNLFTAAIHSGVALALLDRDALAAVDEVYYGSEKMYLTDEYNERGLFPWERDLVDRYFAECRTILVPAAGGGREVLALRRLGYDAVGFECNADLRDFANRLLAKHGLPAVVLPADRDDVPDEMGKLDGVIVGWGAYMLIRGRSRRIAFLRKLRETLAPGAPIVLSFFIRNERTKFFHISMRIGNVVASVLRRPRVELGDHVVPNYAHHFSEAEIRAELREAGFDMRYFATRPYPHAVGNAIA